MECFLGHPLALLLVYPLDQHQLHVMEQASWCSCVCHHLTSGSQLHLLQHSIWVLWRSKVQEQEQVPYVEVHQQDGIELWEEVHAV